MSWQSLFRTNPTSDARQIYGITGLDEEAEEGTGADVVVYAPVITLQDAAPDLIPNPVRKRKTRVQHPDLDELYRDMSKLLVRTALVRAPGWDKGSRMTIEGPHDVAELCRHLVHADQEHIVAIAVDGRSQVLAIHEAAIGSTSSAATTAAHLTKVALLSSASAMAMVHNHPSAVPTPSEDDRRMTTNVKESLSCLGIMFLDHVIVAYDGYYSFESGGGIRAWGT